MKTKIFPINQLTDAQLCELVHAIENGAVIATATDTVYGLAACAYNASAIERIYVLKNRPEHMPLQILIDSVSSAKKWVQWDARADKLARACWPGALTLIARPTPQGRPLLRGTPGLGLRVPQQGVLLRLLAALHSPLACTSANVHGQPVITKQKDLQQFCDGRVDYMLTAGTLDAVASSVVDITGDTKLLREGIFKRNALEKILKAPVK